MKYSDNAMAAILLCSRIGREDDADVKSLTLTEWNRFLEQMQSTGQEVGDILTHNFDGANCFSAVPEIWERIKNLLSRGGAAALELEQLEKRGIGVLTIFDADYPELLRTRLQKKAPPVLFYAGNPILAGIRGIAVTGSRSIDRDGLAFSCQLAKQAAAEDLAVYTGGAKGVDDAAAQTAIRNGGMAVSYLADSLLSRIRRTDTLDALIDGRLLLFSDVNPDAGFSVARAMNRNKYIYASACAAFVVASDYNKGGTWTGATEALKNGWTDVYVWHRPEYAGNARLIELGGIPYESSAENLTETLSRQKNDYEQFSLFAPPESEP